MKKIGIYIHIPFCVKKCDYCDFISYCNSEEKIEKYFIKLKQEINKKLSKLENYFINTIYIGGGTPSAVDSKYIVDVLKEIRKIQDISQCEEITIEVNPGTITLEKMMDYKKAGINRVSIGLQETNDNLLKSIGRIHTYNDFLESYNIVRKLGFNNVNVDLMIGLPNQSIVNIKNSLEKIIKLNPEHISVYSLILEEGTLLHKKIEMEQLKLVDEDLERNMYWYVKNLLEKNNYNHYEISNFSKVGYNSKHNSNCWNQEEYLGIGVAAHSYYQNKRYSNSLEINEYIENNKEILYEKQSVEEQKKEYMLLGLRKIKGINIQQFKNKFGDNPIFIFRIELEELVNNGLIIIDGNYIKLTNKGIDFANKVWEKFV